MRAVIVALGLALGACDLVLPIVEDASTPPSNSFACGPSLMCSLSNPNIGCCVVLGAFDARAPESYAYECVSGSTCALDNGEDGGTRTEIHCDNGGQCPTPGGVCCWPSAAVPVTTYCFSASATNCEYELCDPDAAAPCINVKHPGYVCVSAAGVLPQAPLGYHVCAPPDGG